MDPITSFRSTAFSNFAAVPGGVTLEDGPPLLDLDTLEPVRFPTVEHAYQAAKTLDLKARERIRLLPTAGKAKAAGKRLKLRDDWEEVKIGIMRGLLRQKFAPGTFLAGVLLETGERELIEVNTWGDRFWGECPRGVGENHLGKLLMEIRAELQDVNVCEHGDHPAPPGMRFCSKACADCESCLDDPPEGETCMGICGGQGLP